MKEYSSSTNQTPPAPQELVIEPSHGMLRLNLKEIWAYRELLGILAWRDISVRYKQSVVGRNERGQIGTLDRWRSL
jgi:hypothetical protein